MKLLFATDGSDCSKRALDFLHSFALTPETDVTIVTVVDRELHSIHLDEVSLSDEQQELLNRAHEMLDAEADQLLADERARFADADVSWSWEKRHGKPAEEIVSSAIEQQADLIVVGSHGLGNVKRFLLGSVSDQVVKHAPCSVLIVRPDVDSETATESESDQTLRILLAYDGTAQSQKAAEFCAGLPLPESAELTALSVMPLVKTYRQDVRQQLGLIWQEKRKLLEQGLMQLVNDIDWPMAKVDWQLREGPDVGDEIISTAEENGANLLVMGHKGSGTIKQLLLGSVTGRLTHHAPCSVLVVRASE